MKDKIIKIGLFALGVISVLIASFSDADNVSAVPNVFSGTKNTVYITRNQTYNNAVSVPYKSVVCFSVSDKTYLSCSFPNYGISIDNISKDYCFYNQGGGIVSVSYSCTNSHSQYTYYLYYSIFSLSNYVPSQYTSQECQSQYNLIPVSSVNQSYCVNNNLCPSTDCPDCPDCPDTPVNGFSNIYVNDILHPGAFNIVINIPDEIEWDYAYTGSGSNFNLDVVGYNQNTEYINAIIDQQTYKPTSEDFTRLVGMLPNYAGLLLACLFVILVFYLIKKSFK